MDITKYWCEELIMSIITLASPAEKQIEIIGIGITGDEMLIDFDSSLTWVKDNYVNNGYFSEKNIKKLNEFDKYLDEVIKGQKEDFFVDNNELINNPIWEEIREKAKALLKDLEMSNLDITLDRTISELDNNDRIIIENTKRTLIPQK